MRKEVILIIFLLAVSVSAQENQEEADPGILPSNFFYFVDKSFDNMKLGFASDDEKALVASEIREERIAEAKAVLEEGGDEEDAIASIKDAEIKLKIIQEEITPEIHGEIKESSKESIEILTELKEKVPEEALPAIENAINRQIVEEKKTEIIAEIASKIDGLCSQLIELVGLEVAVKEEPRCNPNLESAPKWLKKKNNEEYKLFNDGAKRKFIEEMRVCMQDPRECRCDEIPIKSFSDKCRVIIPYMIKCQVEHDKTSCMKLGEVSRESEHMFEDLPEDWREEMMDHMMEREDDFKMRMPDECVEAGASTPEACMKLMMEKHMPEECRQANALTPESCEKIMREKHANIMIMHAPSECMENGQFVGMEKCEEIMEEMEDRFEDYEDYDEDEAVRLCQEKTGKSEDECEDMVEGEFEYEDEEDEEREYKMPEECSGLTKEQCMEKMGSTYREYKGEYEFEETYEDYREHAETNLDVLEEGVRALEESHPDEVAKAIESHEETAANEFSGSVVFDVLDIINKIKK